MLLIKMQLEKLQKEKSVMKKPEKKKQKANGSSLKDLRKKIAACDKELIAVLAKRFLLSQEIGAFKIVNKHPILCTEVEEKHISGVIREARKKGIKNVGYVHAIFHATIAESRRIQFELKESGKVGK